MITLTAMDEYDVVVIGGGAAGLSAALVLSRARRAVAVVDAAMPRNAPAAHMHGFLSRDGLPPQTLLNIGRKEVTHYGGEILHGTVARIDPGSEHRFGIVLVDGRGVSARRLVVTTGLRDDLPNIPGVAERWGRDVLHCPYCHGYEVRDEPVGVLAGAPVTTQQVQLIRQWTSDIAFFVPAGSLATDQREQLDARAIGIVEGTVTRLVVDHDRLCGVEIDGGRIVPRTAMFVAPRFLPNNDLLVGLGCAIDGDGWVVRTDATGRTSVPGVWVAGNVASPRAQVITAAGEGSAAAIALNTDMVEEDVERGILTLRSGNKA